MIDKHRLAFKTLLRYSVVYIVYIYVYILMIKEQGI